MRLAALVLAAGASCRAGPVNKLLARDKGGQMMIARTVTSVLESRANAVIIVLGHDAAAVTAALDAAGMRPDGARLRLTHAHDHAEGLSASLRHGIAIAAEAQAEGALVCLGDMPLVRPTTLDRIMAELAGDPQARACAPIMNASRGNPVLWHQSLFTELLALSGDRGGRLLLDRHAARVRDVPVDDPGIFEDFDTPDRLEAYATI
jgi:molybdenum cofactor cytidylyltransferase